MKQSDKRMTNQEMFDRIQDVGIIPAVRVQSAEDALFAAQAIFSGGIPVVEITMTVPDATRVIAELRGSHPGAIIGAGTVLNPDVARQAMDAGAMFLTSTGFDPEIVEFAVKNDFPVIPGALTPTEVMMVQKAGARFIKIFPCTVMGGASYIKTLKGPFPEACFVASGGVSQQTAEEFIHSGASAIGVGQGILPREAIRVRNLDWIHVLTKRFLKMVHEGRGLHAPK
jgi:2-dehydro-3-deoxyphosphogluconate aldolase/(4S)-4-hydroxy-2-oxoglutarate aldolase